MSKKLQILGSFGKQADWLQNNENALDYVKNRTHWVDIATEVWANETDETTFYLQTMDLFFNDTFIVTVDGVKYLCPAFISTWGSYCLGNSRLMGNNLNPESPDMSNPVDMPFCVENTWDDMSFNPPGSMAYVIYSDDNPHTIKIEKITGELVHKLDEKFLPDTIARKTYVDEKVADMVDSAPETLDTLKELATALGEDPNFATTVATKIGSLEEKVGDTKVSEQISEAVSAKQNILTGTEGQVVQIDAAGQAVAAELNLITVEDIDAICGGAIQYAEDVRF